MKYSRNVLDSRTITADMNADKYILLQSLFVSIGTASGTSDPPRKEESLLEGQFVMSQNSYSQDNLSIMDKMTAPNVSFIRRLRCI